MEGKNRMEQGNVLDGLHEECGVFGIYDFDGGNVASSVYYGLLALQHRGQESCGIAVGDTDGPRKVTTHKGMGLVNEVFTPEILENMHGDIGVGHTRYSTAGSSTRENAQPLVLNYIKGTLAVAHNGNLINAPQLRRELEYSGAIFQTTIDSEVIAYHIARERVNSASVEEAVSHAMNKIQGAYSLVVMSPRKLVGARDPYGFRPLCIGKRDNTYILASESCALQTSLSATWSLARSSAFLRNTASYQTRVIACRRRKQPDVFLNIFILQDRTVTLMVSVSMVPVLKPENILLWTARWMQTW